MMRARLQKYLPIFLIALLVQVLAPIGVSWAAAIAASDPLGTAEICRDGGSVVVGQQDDHSGQQHDHGSACSICCVAGASAFIDMPMSAAFAKPYREPARVVWRSQVRDLSHSRIGSNAQSRGPPFQS